jgi:RNA polymerase sigma-70 factor (ECF subfamily)
MDARSGLQCGPVRRFSEVAKSWNFPAAARESLTAANADRLLAMPPNPTLSDGDLLRRMWAGEEEAFTALYRRHQGVVYRFALQMSGRTEIAEEVTQDVFMLLMRDRKQYDPAQGPLPAYLYGVARNHVRRALERRRSSPIQMEEGELESGPVAAGDVLGDLTQRERLESLRQAILKLPAPYREAIVLCELHEMDYEAAAVVMGCPVGTVRSRLHRARALLASKMGASERCPV